MRTPLFIFWLLLVSVSCNSLPKYDNNNGSKALEPSTVKVTWDTSIFFLNYCSAIRNDTSLHLRIVQRPERFDIPYELEVVVSPSKTGIEFYQTYSMTDCLYVVSNFKVVSQNIIFDKTSYKTGAKLKGEIDLLLLGRHSYFREPGEMRQRGDYDTVKVQGQFSAIVE